MKTTIDLPPSLLRAAKKLAAKRGTTLRELVERGLRTVLDEAVRDETKPFRIRDESVPGRGLRPELRDAEWSEIRAAAYEGRGG